MSSSIYVCDIFIFMLQTRFLGRVRDKLNQAKYKRVRYLPYGWSILSTGHDIGEHFQSFASDIEKLRYSQFYIISISAVSELKSTLFLVFP